MDANELGYETNVILDACRGVDAESTKEAVHKMRMSGINVEEFSIMCVKLKFADYS